MWSEFASENGRTSDNVVNAYPVMMQFVPNVKRFKKCIIKLSIDVLFLKNLF